MERERIKGNAGERPRTAPNLSTARGMVSAQHCPFIL